MSIGYDGNLVVLPMAYNATTGWGVLGYDLSDGAANDVVGIFYVPFKCILREVGLYITEATDTGASLFYFDKIAIGVVPTEDGDCGAVNLPNPTVIGKVYYDLVGKGTVLVPGEAIECSFQTDGAGAGKVVPYVIVEYCPEVKGNLTAMVETA
jgi:hypothetical protein